MSTVTTSEKVNKQRQETSLETVSFANNGTQYAALTTGVTVHSSLQPVSEDTQTRTERTLSVESRSFD